MCNMVVVIESTWFHWKILTKLWVKIALKIPIANEFNIYFVSLAPKLNDPDDYTIINIEPVQPFTVFLKQSNASSIYLQDCTPDEISKIISGLENG